MLWVPCRSDGCHAPGVPPSSELGTAGHQLISGCACLRARCVSSALASWQRLRPAPVLWFTLLPPVLTLSLQKGSPPRAHQPAARGGCTACAAFSTSGQRGHAPTSVLQKLRNCPKFGNNNRHTPDTAATPMQNYLDPFFFFFSPKQSRRVLWLPGCRLGALLCFRHGKNNILQHLPLRHGSTVFAGTFSFSFFFF